MEAQDERNKVRKAYKFIEDLDVKSVPVDCIVKKYGLGVQLTFTETGSTDGYCDWHRSFQIQVGMYGVSIDLYVYGSYEYYQQVSGFFWHFCLNTIKDQNFKFYLFYSGTNGLKGRNLDDVGDDYVDPRFFEDFTNNDTRYYIAVETPEERDEIVNVVRNDQLITV